MSISQDAKDAWALQSWLIWPNNERKGARPETFRELADALEAWPGGLEGAARRWPNALRKVAERIAA